MGQYFKAVNLKKREYICPWCLFGVAKLWEWSANPWGAIFPLLLRKSTEGGGGDYHGPTYEHDKTAIAGRWAGDPVVLVGDYDASKLLDKLDRYRNISREVVKAWNPFIERDDMKLKFNPRCSCNKHP